MRSAEVTLKVTAKKKVIYFDIFIKRLSTEIFNLGTSSWLFNHDKTVMNNPVVVWQREKYSTGDYAPIWTTAVLQSCVGIQVTCSGKGNPVNKNEERVVSIKMNLLKTPANVQWRARDTATLTPDHLDIETTYLIR